MKRKVSLLMLITIMLFGFALNINAQNINDLKSNEIVVGNTKFSANTWISASRAAKAGALFTNATGRLDVKTYYFVNNEIIYELSDEGDYKLLTQEQLDSLYIELNIYYEDNEALEYTYTRDESLEEDLHFNWFFDLYDNMTIKDSNVKVDVENETITCNFGQNFEFEINFCYDEECLSAEVEQYIGKCGFDYKFTTEYVNYTTPIEIKNIDVPQDIKYLNQNKVHMDDIYDVNDIYLNITDKLESYQINEYLDKDTYYAIDLVFDENNDISNYDIYSDYYYEIDYSGKPNVIRLLLPLNMYLSYDYFQFIIIDNEHNSFEKFNVTITGLEKINDDFEISELTVTDDSINQNNIAIREVEYVENKYDVYLTQKLEKTIHNDIEGKWLAFDLNISEIFDLNHLDVYTYYDKFEQIIDTEIFGNTLRLWINVELLEDDFIDVKFNYNLTNGENLYMICLNLIDESDNLTYEWGEERDTAGKSYLYVVDASGNVTRGIVNISYNNSDVTKDIIVSENGYLLVPELVTINSVSKIEEGEY